jgi:lipid-binding SYLF domain-containing protein
MEREKYYAAWDGKRWKRLILALAIGIWLGGMALAAEDSKEEERAEIRSMAKKTLAQLYKMQPEARRTVENAAGYAVFSNFGLKIFTLGSGQGEGLAFNNETKKEVFMKMLEVQAGWGLGIKKFRLVWIFGNQAVLSDFINSGWELGGQGTGAAQVDDTGAAVAGAMSVSPGVWLYQMTEDGLALELTAKGTKYYKDDDLN